MTIQVHQLYVQMVSKWTSVAIPMAVVMIQQQQAQIERLERRIQELEQRLGKALMPP